MKVYKHEAELANIIKANTSIAFVSRPKILTESFQLSEAHLKNISKATNLQQPDLHYLMTILASVGWNLNTDVFDREEVYNARATPEDKPFNYQHTDDVIGHITDTFMLDEKMAIIDASTKFEDMPTKFHLATSAVLYKVWPTSKEKQDRTKTIIAEIAENKWFVSMECLFHDFDYALINNDDNSQHIIARNDDTSFLTKHLKAYGGTGKYENYSIGRLLRNITFCGKGLVSNPANPESIIFAEVKNFSGVVAKILTINKSLGYINDEGKKTENDMSAELQKQLDEYKAKSDEHKGRAEAALKDLGAEKLKLETLQIEEKNLKALLASTNDEVKKEKEAKANVDKELESLKKELESTKAELATAKSELDKIAVAKKLADRISKLKDTLKVDEAKAVDLEKAYAKLDDDAFNANLEVLASTVKDVPNPDTLKNANPDKDGNAARASENDNALNDTRKAIAERLSKKNKGKEK